MKNLLEKVEKIIHFATQAVYFYRKQNYTKGHTSSISVINLGERYYIDAESVGFMENINFLLPIWKELLEVVEAGDEIYLADVYDNKLIPALFEIQSYIVDMLGGNPPIYWEENMSILKDKDTQLFETLVSAVESEKREYILSFACTGDAVLSVKTEPYGNVMLSSYINPWQEAVVYGDELERETAKKCVIFGLGMGYHVKYIASLLHLEEIIVLESDLEQLRICMMYTNMKNLLSDKRIKIVLCDKASDYIEWLKKSGKNKDIIYKIWYPSVKTIEDSEIRELLENYWVNINSASNLGNILLDNFEKNQKLGDESVDVLQEDFKDKDLIIVGAGPSLDDSLDYLRKLSLNDNIRIVCVGKAAKKIISENIIPSYIVMIDGKASTRWQIKGIENCGVPLIYLSTVAHNVAADYEGKRYIAYQEGIEPSKQYAEKEGFMIFQSGGSVATFAIDMAIRMKCKRIICVGLDMGYIDKRTHAKGIGSKIYNKKSLRKVEALGGGEIYTSKTLDIYRKWIERRIENVKEVKFINASAGAKIRGMEEKSLKEIGIEYCNKIIYCYVEEQKDGLNEFIERNNSNSLVRILLSIIDSCEGKIYYCLCHIINNYMKVDKKLWFATDIKSLYEVVKEFFSFLFEKIVYIEQENNREFEKSFEIRNLINYFIGIQDNKQQASLMKELWKLKKNGDIDNIAKFLDNLKETKVEKQAGLWCCFCELLLYEINNTCFEEKYFYYKLTLYSILMKLSAKAYYTNAYLNEILTNKEIKTENTYFVYHQLKRNLLTGQVAFDEKSRYMYDELYDKCYKEFMEKSKKHLVKIPLIERNKDLVMILTVQFLKEGHAPTNSVIERAKAFMALGKRVIILNTAEICLINGYVPMYNVDIGNVIKEYDDINEIKIGEDKVAFLQMPDDLPVIYRMQVLTHILNKIKPYYILAMGTGSILADLCGNIVPCASMALAFSTLPKTKNKMKVLGRKLNPEERKCYADSDIIESKFTFELKKQKKKFSREEMSLPKDKFILIVVGIRLQYEISTEFIKMLEKVCKNGCYVVFVGVMNNYDDLIKENVTIKENSSFIGYCYDMLALMEIGDLYVNPDRIGGGFSIIEAFSKGKPGVYLRKGDVYTAGGESFAVNDFDAMAKQILRYKNDREYYEKMAGIAKERAKFMTSSLEAMADIDNQICQRIEEKYW